MSRNGNGLALFAIFMWLFWAGMFVGFWGAVIYVALHFIHKLW